ncbi:serine/threonine-protein kinase [Kitasatospora sp. MMS16-BH015]|uniref:serine/threonine-protein kinase n=1 Tax=Kitasatospora sp. MMS16-BH015 TaxID=2018025 RepID=UPI00352D1BAA
MRLRREDPRIVGPYRLHRRLGAGGMGVVYLGSDRRGQRVALKLIRAELAEDAEFRTRFAREIAAASRIRGACTARVVGSDIEADRPWLATAYVPGPSLYKRVGEEGPLPWPEAARIGAALADGLVKVHEAGVVHRDLKPSNILLSPKGPRIIDFGIAWSRGASTLTHVGTAVGSPGFLAPEQVRGVAVTPATDVFAFGATLAYSVTGDTPFGSGASSEVMLYRVVHEEPDLSAVPAPLAPLVRACLAKEPTERPGAAALHERLSELAARGAAGAPRGRSAAANPVPPAGRPGRPEELGAAGAGGVGVAGGAGGGPGEHGRVGGQAGRGGHGGQLGAAGAGGRGAAAGHQGHGGAAGAGLAGGGHGGNGHGGGLPGAAGYAGRGTNDGYGAAAGHGRGGAPAERGAAEAYGRGGGGHGAGDAYGRGGGAGQHGAAEGYGAGAGRADGPGAGRGGVPPVPRRPHGQAVTAPMPRPDGVGGPRERRGGRDRQHTPVPGRPGGASGARQRLRRQRAVVFVTVTLGVALAIAAAQGCENRSKQGLAPDPAPTVASVTAQPQPPGGLSADGAQSPVPPLAAVAHGTGDSVLGPAVGAVPAVDWGNRSYTDPAGGPAIRLRDGKSTAEGAQIAVSSVLGARYRDAAATVVVLRRAEGAVPVDLVELFGFSGDTPVLLASRASAADATATASWRIEGGALIRDERTPTGAGASTRYAVRGDGSFDESWPGAAVPTG